MSAPSEQPDLVGMDDVGRAVLKLPDGLEVAVPMDVVDKFRYIRVPADPEDGRRQG